MGEKEYYPLTEKQIKQRQRDDYQRHMNNEADKKRNKEKSKIVF